MAYKGLKSQQKPSFCSKTPAGETPASPAIFQQAGTPAHPDIFLLEAGWRPIRAGWRLPSIIQSEHLFQYLADGGVREDYLLELRHGVAHADGKGRGGYELGAGVAYHMHAQHSLLALVYQHLA